MPPRLLTTIYYLLPGDLMPPSGLLGHQPCMSFTGIHAGKSTRTHKVKIQNVKTDSVSRDNKVLCPLNSSSAD